MIPLEVKFDHFDCTLMLSLPVQEIPLPVTHEADRRGFALKREFHISVTVSENARKVRLAVDELGQREETLQNLETLAHTYSWEYAHTGDYSVHEESYSKQRLLSTGKVGARPHMRRAIVERVMLPDLARYYAALSALLGVAFTVPIPHVSLYTWSDAEEFASRGVGISSAADFEQTMIARL